ncbi:MAG: hypothetical protein LIO40_01710 [Ruminococcus sp.]|nr:hypothetical protein [Ruminococcus sp.]
MFLDDLYVNWRDAVSNGLILLRRRLYREYQQKQLEMQSAHDPATGLYNKN